MSILKLSYDNLESPLKVCFTYCSLFPKDFKINKEKLIRLWMAQGYIVPFDVGQSVEDAAEEYYSILLRRCFFQGVEMNEFGGVQSFRIHDLHHDVAQKVAGKDAMSLNSIPTQLGDDVHHVFHVGSRCNGNFIPKCKIRSYVRDGFQIKFPVVKLVENWKFLRTLDLHDLDIQVLPDSVGRLLHLRYLDLSENKHLLRLPNSITKLFNLLTLDLKNCSGLKDLPKDLAKLVNLRHLDITHCFALNQMPQGLDKLSYLCVLTTFVVDKENLCGFENLRALINLRGSIRIRIAKNFKQAKEDSKFEEGYLRRMKHLEEIVVDFLGHENHESWLAKLEPPSSLQALILNGYKEKALPTKWWHGDATLSTFLPNLVRLSISSSNLMHLPSLSKLLHLKSLSFINLGKLEYMEDTTYGTDAFTFFPSLECLKLLFMNDLKQWWKSGEVKCNVRQPSFVKLSELSVEYCREFVSFPACPRLEKLKLVGVNKEFRMSFGGEEGLIKLREVQIENLGDLQSLPTQSLTSLCIHGNEELESFSELGDTFFKSCFSLRTLEIVGCSSFRSLNGGWWKHLTTLQSLKLHDVPILTFSGQPSDTNPDDDGIPWRFLERSLRSLQFMGLEIKILPKGIRHLTSLLNLDLVSCKHLEYLPEWLSCLSSLQCLRIINCRRLKSLPYQVRDLTSLQILLVRWCPLVAEQFQDINGNEWLNLRHISTVDIRAGQIIAQD